MDRQRADLPLDPRRLRNDDPNHRRGGYGRDRSPRSRSRIYLISPRGTTVPRQRVRPTLNLLFFFLLLLFPPFPTPTPSSIPSSASSPHTSLGSRFEHRFSSPPTREIDAILSLFLSLSRRLHSLPPPPPSLSLLFRSTYIHVFVRECDRPAVYRC